MLVSSQVSASYWSISSDTPVKLWQSLQLDVVSGERFGRMKLCQLRPATAYALRVYTWVKTKRNLVGNATATPNLVFSSQFETSVTGFNWMASNGAFAHALIGSPSWNVLSLAHSVDGGTFTGIIMLDSAGFVVWYQDFNVGSGFLSWDQFDTTYDLAVLSLSLSDGDMCDGGTVDCSTLQLVDAGGVVKKSYRQKCYDDAINYNSLHHECRVWDRTKVLSFAAKIQEYDGLYLEYIDHKVSAPTYLITDVLVEWDTVTNSLSKLVDFADNGINPLDVNMVSNTSTTFTSIEAKCELGGSGGDWSIEAVEWSHASAAAPGIADNFVVAFRNLNLIISVGIDSGEIEWRLSSSLPSDFTFANPVRSRFYNPHSVQQLMNGNIVLMDDGSMRPNCTCDFDGCDAQADNCYSRAVEYELDFERMQARVSWEFEFPRSVSLTNATAGVGHLSDLSNPGTTLRSIEKTDYYLNDGGSVYTLGNGNYVVSFTYIDNVFGDTQWPNATRTFEVDARGQAIAELITPGTWRNYRNGAWRAIPFDSVCGETAECPAEMSDEQCGELT